MKTVLAGMAAASLLAAGPINLGQASPGNTFFNRPGASFEGMKVDLLDCGAKAATTSTQAQAVAGEGIVSGFVAASITRQGFKAALENCMVVKGWRVAALDDSKRDDYANLPPDQLATLLRTWTGATLPPGQIVRQWDNAAADGATKRLPLQPGLFGKLSLSASALASELNSVASQRVSYRAGPKGKAVTELSLAKLGALDPSKGLVVFNFKHTSVYNGSWLFLERIGKEGDVPLGMYDPTSNQISATGTIGRGELGNTQFFQVPPGVWRIRSLKAGGGYNTLNFCLGSPQFEIKAGEAVYAGSMDLGGVIGPVMELAPPRRLLSGLPELAARLRPAEWVNGSIGQCQDQYLYALEFPSAPFLEGYRWGSRAPGG